MPEPRTPSTAPTLTVSPTGTATTAGSAARPLGQRPAAVAMAPADALWLRDLVRRRSAIVLDESKQYLLDTRLAPLVRSEGFASVADLVARARAGDRRVVDLVVDAMTTNETSWFRDSGPFEALRTAVLPALVRDRAAERRIRIWSAACSSGQEAYSIAMICSEVVPAGWTVEIVGTDLSPAMVERATAGRFSQLEVNRGLPASHLVRWFERDGSHWQVSAQLRRMTRFREGNLAQPFTDLGRFDVVMLRNVLIYFDGDTKVDILRRTRAVVRPDGYLFLGAAETALGMDVGWTREQLSGTSVLRLDGVGPTVAPAAGLRSTGFAPGTRAGAAAPLAGAAPLRPSVPPLRPPAPGTAGAGVRAPVPPARLPVVPARTGTPPARAPLPRSSAPLSAVPPLRTAGPAAAAPAATTFPGPALRRTPPPSPTGGR